MFARQTKRAVYKNEEKINTNVDKTIIGFHLCDLVKFNPHPPKMIKNTVCVRFKGYQIPKFK